MQSGNFVCLNENMRLEIFNRYNAEILFQKLLWRTNEFAGLTITNSELNH